LDILISLKHLRVLLGLRVLSIQEYSIHNPLQGKDS
jgi:hypothetical protein